MEKLPITYRLAGVADLELLTQTRLEFLEEGGSGLNDSQKAEMYAQNRAYFDETLRDGSFAAYLAFDGEQLAATSGISFYSTPPNTKNTTGKTAYIANMFTKPEYRGRGIATRLFDMAVKEARRRGCGKVALSATDMGRPIYNKYGFFTPKGAMEYFFDK